MIVFLAALLLALLCAASLALAWAARTTARDHEAATFHSLQLAREALLAYAADRAIDAGVGPGYLPCPDRDGDGWAEPTCGSLAGDSGQAQRLGLLPWKTLGLPELRDAEGEPLWYAVSTRHKGLLNCAASVACVDMTPATALGTISVRDASGAWLHDGRLGDAARAIEGGAAAVVIAPGAPIARAGGSATQARGCAPGTCSPASFLDLAPGLDDNASFQDRSDARAANGDGFIAGPVSGADGARLVNDRLLAIGYADLMPRVMARVAIEVGQCLRLARAGSGAWPAPAAGCDAATPPTMGRVPDIALPGCNLGSGPRAWWSTWSPFVLYARPAACAISGDCVHLVDGQGNTLATGHAAAIAVGVRPGACTTPRVACDPARCDARTSEGLDVLLPLP